jgi:hypothetical protein
MDFEVKGIILLGYFNCDWSQEKEGPHTNRLADLANIYINYMQQLIEDPSRIARTSSKLIDLTFTNKPEIIHTCGVDHL